MVIVERKTVPLPIKGSKPTAQHGKMVIIDGKKVTTNGILGPLHGKMVIIEGKMVIYHGLLVIEMAAKQL